MNGGFRLAVIQIANQIVSNHIADISNNHTTALLYEAAPVKTV